MAIGDIFKGDDLRKRIAELEEYSNNSYQENLQLRALLNPEQQEVMALQDRLNQLNGAISAANNQLTTLYNASKALEAEVAEKRQFLVTFDDEVLVQSFGLYQPRYDFANSTQYAERLKSIRQQQKDLIKSKGAVTGRNDWTVNNSKSEGKKLINQTQKLLLRAFNSDCDDIIRRVKHSNISASVESIRKTAETISKLGSVMMISITSKYVQLKVEEAYLAFEYQQAKQEEKERLRELREQEKEERALQKEIEEKRKSLDKEKKHYSNMLETLNKRLGEAKEEDMPSLHEKQRELEQTLMEIEAAIKDVDYREVNKKAGFVYIISNIGAFGEGVYKIGMTRRLEPSDRIYELGDASVPFRYDTHALIFTDDAPGLEAKLHSTFESKRVNKANYRREFFRVSLDEIKQVVIQNHDKTVEFTDVPDAEEYRTSLRM